MREEGEKGSDVKQKQERPYFILLLLRAINSHILIWQRRERRTWVAKVDAQTTDIYFYTQRDQDRAFQFGQKKVSIRFSLPNRFFSIRFGNLINLPLVH